MSDFHLIFTIPGLWSFFVYIKINKTTNNKSPLKFSGPFFISNVKKYTDQTSEITDIL